MLSEVLPETQLNAFFIPFLLALKNQELLFFSSRHILKILVGLKDSL